MHTTPALIELAKQRLALKHGLTLPMTDYRLAKLMELSTQNLTSWKTGRTRIGTQFARKFAEACDLSPEYVYACVQAERTDNPDEISLLERIADHFKGTKAAGWIVAAMLAAGMSFAPMENQAVAATSEVDALPIMRQRRRRRPRALIERLARFFTVFPVATLEAAR